LVREQQQVGGEGKGEAEKLRRLRGCGAERLRKVKR
jgi:hypothetical protein